MCEDVKEAQCRGTVVEASKHDISEHVEARNKIELLEDHGAVALPVAQCSPLQRRDFRVIEINGTRGRIDEAVDHAQQRRLAGA